MEIKVRSLVKFLSIFIIATVILAIPYMIYKKVQESSRVSKVKSSYAMLSDAYKKAVSVENFKWTKETMNTPIFAKGYLNHLEVEKVCGFDPSKNCFAKELHYLRPYKGASWSPMEGFYKVRLKNGMNIAFKVLVSDCSGVRGRFGSIFVDINGLKGPNQLGKDIFDFGIFKEEIKPYEIEIVHRERCIEGNGQGCASYVLKYGNMNYKKFNKLYEKELRQQRQQQKEATSTKK